MENKRCLNIIAEEDSTEGFKKQMWKSLTKKLKDSKTQRYKENRKKLKQWIYQRNDKKKSLKSKEVHQEIWGVLVGFYFTLDLDHLKIIFIP